MNGTVSTGSNVGTSNIGAADNAAATAVSSNASAGWPAYAVGTCQAAASSRRAAYRSRTSGVGSAS